jgi:hypothetical protein
MPGHEEYAALEVLSIVCPECGLEVALRPSNCPCAMCSSYVYLADHWKNGKLCFGSGHAVKPDSANVRTFQAERISKKSADDKGAN